MLSIYQTLMPVSPTNVSMALRVWTFPKRMPTTAYARRVTLASYVRQVGTNKVMYLVRSVGQVTRMRRLANLLIDPWVFQCSFDK